MILFKDPSEIPQVRHGLGLMMIATVALFMPSVLMAMGALLARDQVLLQASTQMFMGAIVVTSIIAAVAVMYDKRSQRLEAGAA